MARRGRDTLRLRADEAGGADAIRARASGPHAVVQLRQDNLAAEHYSMVGFQTQLRWPEQKRIFRTIPGLERADFVRLGQIHRNCYINAPRVLDATLQTRARPGLFFAGQISGVEGYTESAATGLLAGINAARLAAGRPTLALPADTMLGALCRYISHADPRATSRPMPPSDCFPSRRRAIRGRKRDRRLARSAQRARDRSTRGSANIGESLGRWRARREGERNHSLVSMERFLAYLQDQRRVSPETLRAYRSDLAAVPDLPGRGTLRTRRARSRTASTRSPFAVSSRICLEAVWKRPRWRESCRPSGRSFDMPCATAAPRSIPPRRSRRRGSVATCLER